MQSSLKLVDCVIEVHDARISFAGCDTVTYNKKYIFGLCPHSWPRAPKTFGISEVMREIKVPFMLRRQLRKAPQDGAGAGTPPDNPHFLAPREGGGWR